MKRKWFILLAITLPVLLTAAWIWDRNWVYPYLALILPIEADRLQPSLNLFLRRRSALER